MSSVQPKDSKHARSTPIGMYLDKFVKMQRTEGQYDWVWLQCIADELEYSSDTIDGRFCRWLSHAQVYPSSFKVNAISPRCGWYTISFLMFNQQHSVGMFELFRELNQLSDKDTRIKLLPKIHACIPSTLFEPIAQKQTIVDIDAFMLLHDSYTRMQFMGKPPLKSLKCPHCGLVQDVIHPTLSGELMPHDVTECWNCTRYFTREEE